MHGGWYKINFTKSLNSHVKFDLFWTENRFICKYLGQTIEFHNYSYPFHILVSMVITCMWPEGSDYFLM